MFLGSGFGRPDFSRICIFGPPDFFADFFASFLWKKCPEKILQENPREDPPKFIQQKSSDTFLQNGRTKGCCSLESWDPLRSLKKLERPKLCLDSVKTLSIIRPLYGRGQWVV